MPHTLLKNARLIDGIADQAQAEFNSHQRRDHRPGRQR